MKKIILSVVLIASVSCVITVKSQKVNPISVNTSVDVLSPNVAWGVHAYTKSESAAVVSGTGAAIATTGAVKAALTGAKWGVRIGKYAGPWGALAGAVVGGL